MSLNNLGSLINIYPITGLINVTKFTVQSRENEYLSTNSYRFYYYLKGISTAPINFFSNYGGRDANVVFEYLNIPDYIKEVSVEVYIDIYPLVRDKYTLFRQLKIFKSVDFIGNFNYTTILQTLSINNGMSKEMLLDAQKTLSRLETDLPVALNPIYNKTKVQYSPNGEISILTPKCEDKSYCNNRGVCFIVGMLPYCRCKSPFKGRFCQISEYNLKVLEEYSKNISQITYYNLFNNTNFSIPNALSDQIIENIYLEFNRNIKLFDKFEDIDLYIKTLNLILSNADKGNVIDKLKANKNGLIDMVNSMISFLQNLIFSEKYNNLNAQIKSRNQYVDPSGKYSLKFLNESFYNSNSTSNATILELNNSSFSVGINANNTNKNKQLLNIFANAKNLNKHKLNNRKLQGSSGTNNVTNIINTNSNNKYSAINSTEANINYINNNDNYIIEIYNSSILSLTSDQVLLYKEQYNQLKSLFESFIIQTIKANSLDKIAIKINQANEMFNFTLDNFSISDFSQFNFEAYFKDRKDNKQTYFDAKACISENMKSFKSQDANYFYIAYVFYNIPLFSLYTDLLKSSISLSNSIYFYDAAGNYVNLTCSNSEIIHYMPLYPNNQDFLDKFLYYPKKYQKNDFIYLSRQYMPFYIFPNGTIDHFNSLSRQKDLYYRQYSLNVTQYSDNLLYTNLSFTTSFSANFKSNSYNNFSAINNLNTSNTDSRQSNSSEEVFTSYFKYIKDLDYIVAGSRNSGEFATFAYEAPLVGPMGNNYYLDYMQIFSCKENYRNNFCFILILVLFALNVILFLGSIALKSCFRRYKNNREWCIDEEKQLYNDCLIFQENRYSFCDFEQKSFCNANNYSNRINFSIHELNKCNNYKKTNNYNNSNSKTKKKDADKIIYNFNRNKDLNAIDNIIIPVDRELNSRNKLNSKEMSKANNKENALNNIEANIINAQRKNSSSEDKYNENNPSAADYFESESLQVKIKLKENKLRSSNKDLDLIKLQEPRLSNNEKIKIDKDPEKFEKLSIYSANAQESQRNRIYSLLHFICFRNIYTSLLNLNSPFSPKYKTYSKVMFLIYTEMLFVLCLFIFGPFDFINYVIKFFMQYWLLHLTNTF